MCSLALSSKYKVVYKRRLLPPFSPKNTLIYRINKPARKQQPISNDMPYLQCSARFRAQKKPCYPEIYVMFFGVEHCKYTLIFHISIFVHGKMDFRGEVVTAGDVSPRRPVSRFSLITLHLLIHTLSLGFMAPGGRVSRLRTGE